jgi:serine protease Do
MRTLSAALVALAALPAAASEPTQRDLLEAFERQLKAVHETAGPGVACVVASRSEHYPKPAKPPAYPGQLGDFDRAAFLKADPGKAVLANQLDLADPRNSVNHTSAGGVVIDPSGLVLTTYQSIDGATKVYVHLPGGKGSYADVHAADSRSDLAVLKLLTPPPGLKPVTFGEVRFADAADGRKATVHGGKLFVVMTLPPSANLAPDRPSGRVGALSNTVRKMYTGQTSPRHVYEYGTLLELDPKLLDPRQNYAVSGAGVFNLAGELIGLTTQAVPTADNGPGYALPVDKNTRRIVDVLRRGEEVEYGYLGVQLSGNTDLLSSLTLSRVTRQGPAWQAGLQNGDEILRIDGVPASTFGDLQFQAACALAGARLKLAVRRRNEQFDAEVTLGKYPSDHPFVASVRPDPVFGLQVDYGTVLAFRISMNNFRVESDGVPAGVCVRELVPGSPAEKQFRRLGDAPKRWLITHANGKPVGTPAAFREAAKGQASVRLTVTDPSDFNSGTRELTIP